MHRVANLSHMSNDELERAFVSNPDLTKRLAHIISKSLDRIELNESLARQAHNKKADRNPVSIKGLEITLIPWEESPFAFAETQPMRL